MISISLVVVLFAISLLYWGKGTPLGRKEEARRALGYQRVTGLVALIILIIGRPTWDNLMQKVWSKSKEYLKVSLAAIKNHKCVPKIEIPDLTDEQRAQLENYKTDTPARDEIAGPNEKPAPDHSSGGIAIQLGLDEKVGEDNTLPYAKFKNLYPRLQFFEDGSAKLPKGFKTGEMLLWIDEALRKLKDHNRSKTGAMIKRRLEEAGVPKYIFEALCHNGEDSTDNPTTDFVMPDSVNKEYSEIIVQKTPAVIKEGNNAMVQCERGPAKLEKDNELAAYAILDTIGDAPIIPDSRIQALLDTAKRADETLRNDQSETSTSSYEAEEEERSPYSTDLNEAPVAITKPVVEHIEQETNSEHSAAIEVSIKEEDQVGRADIVRAKNNLQHWAHAKVQSLKNHNDNLRPVVLAHNQAPHAPTESEKHEAQLQTEAETLRTRFRLRTKHAMGFIFGRRSTRTGSVVRKPDCKSVPFLPISEQSSTTCKKPELMLSDCQWLVLTKRKRGSMHATVSHPTSVTPSPPSNNVLPSLKKPTRPARPWMRLTGFLLIGCVVSRWLLTYQIIDPSELAISQSKTLTQLLLGSGTTFALLFRMHLMRSLLHSLEVVPRIIHELRM